MTEPTAPVAAITMASLVWVIGESSHRHRMRSVLHPEADLGTALAIEKAGSTDWTKIRNALREICCSPGEVIEPGEWAKAKAAIAAGKKINYEGASGNCDFDEYGDVTDAYGLYVVEGAFKQIGLFKQ